MKNLKEPKLTYALNSSGKMIHIGAVERGLSCNCICPKCKEFLVAKLGHEGGRQAHFAHQKGSDCHGSYMTALHKLAEQIIEEEKAVMAPSYKEISKQKLSFERVEVESRVERKDLQSDIVGITADGLRWSIEIRNTHEVDEVKRAKLTESKITCLEIDVREQKLEDLKGFLLESANSREWINNPNYDEQIFKAKRNRVSQIEKLLLECDEIKIPSYANSGRMTISIKEATMVSKTEDGLCVRIKAISSDNTPYAFVVSYHHIEETINHSLEQEKDCNELTVFIDNLSPDSAISLDGLDFQWSYHYVSEKEKEARLREYRNNPKYEIRPKKDCYSSQCKYRPYQGKCIYSEAFVVQDGMEFVVCNREKKQSDNSYDTPRSQANYSFSLDAGRQQIDNQFLEVKAEEISCQEFPQSRQKREKTSQNAHDNSSSDGLPFEKFWTIKDYYEKLQLSTSYKTEKGLLAKIIRLDRTSSGILLLCEDPQEAKSFCPYHIFYISANDGVLVRNKCGDYTKKYFAFGSYNQRLNSMNQQTGYYNNSCLPF